MRIDSKCRDQKCIFAYIFFKKSNLMVTTIGSGDLNSRSLCKKNIRKCQLNYKTFDHIN